MLTVMVTSPLVIHVTSIDRLSLLALLAWPGRSTTCRASSAQSRSFISTAVLLHTRSAQPHSRRPARPDRARVAVQYESARLGGGRRVLRGVYICSRCENSKTLAQRQVFTSVIAIDICRS